MFCISVSYRKTPLAVREKFSFSREEQKIFLERLLNKKLITGGVLVSTCNRSEIYFTGSKEQLELVEQELSEYKRIEREQIKEYFLFYVGKPAVKHLFYVASGLDSMVLGEDEILHQVKEAYLSAAECGFTDGELNILFQGAFNCAKLAKSSTRLSTTPVSIGTLTANEIERYITERRRKEKSESLVLVIGATGKIGSIVAKDLLAKGIPVLGTGRHHQGEGELFWQGKEKMNFIDFRERYQYVNQVDAIVSATASPHYTLTKEAFLKEMKGEKECLLVDLAVPCDIDQALEQIPGISLLDIDYFEQAAKENRDIKLGELEKAKEILRECLEDTLKKLYMRDFKEKLAEKDKEGWFEKMVYYLKEVLDSEQLLQVLERIYEKETGEE